MKRKKEQKDLKENLKTKFKLKDIYKEDIKKIFDEQVLCKLTGFSCERIRLV